MRKRFASRPFLRRLIALTAAYAIVLSSLVVSFGVARAAFPAHGTITCHNEGDGTKAPAGGQTDGKLCDASCCIGCLMLTAALPPPQAKVVDAPRSAGRAPALSVAVDFRSDPGTKSHQSRAPPQPA